MRTLYLATNFVIGRISFYQHSHSAQYAAEPLLRLTALVFTTTIHYMILETSIQKLQTIYQFDH